MKSNSNIFEESVINYKNLKTKEEENAKLNEDLVLVA
jgi:hypothetical protein